MLETMGAVWDRGYKFRELVDAEDNYKNISRRRKMQRQGMLRFICVVYQRERPYGYLNRCAQLLSCVRLFATPWTEAHQAPLSMGFSRHKYWSGLPCPPPGNFPIPGIELRSPTLQADSLPSEPPGKPISIDT